MSTFETCTCIISAWAAGVKAGLRAATETDSKVQNSEVFLTSVLSKCTWVSALGGDHTWRGQKHKEFLQKWDQVGEIDGALDTGLAQDTVGEPTAPYLPLPQLPTWMPLTLTSNPTETFLPTCIMDCVVSLMLRFSSFFFLNYRSIEVSRLVPLIC